MVSQSQSKNIPAKGVDYPDLSWVLGRDPSAVGAGRGSRKNTENPRHPGNEGAIHGTSGEVSRAADVTCSRVAAEGEALDPRRPVWILSLLPSDTEVVASCVTPSFLPGRRLARLLGSSWHLTPFNVKRYVPSMW